MVLLPKSATKRLVPLPQRATGFWNRAVPEVPPVPSAEPGVVEPASRLTTLVLTMIFRISLFKLSATQRFVPSQKIPCGEEKVAAVPVPFAEPGVPLVEPASSVTEALDITICRISLLSVSATNKLVPSPQMPFGFLNLAFVPVKFDNPEVP